MSELINILICLINAGMMVYTFALFFDSFSTARVTLGARLCIFIGISVAFTVVLWLTPLGFLRTLLLISMPILVSLVFKLKWYNHILLSFLAFALIAMSELVVTLLLSSLFSVNTQEATQGVFQVVGIVLSKMLLILMIVLFRFRKYKIAYAISFQKSLALLMIPISTIIIVFIHVYWFLQIPFESQLLAASNIVSYVILVISNIIVFHIIDISYRNEEKEKQIVTSQELIQAQAEQYKQLQEHHQTILKIRHDQKNFLIGLITELKNNNINHALDSLQQEYDLLIYPDELEYSNSIVSAVIKAKSKIAQQNNIQIDFSYNEIQKVLISNIDIAIILGNALDNAIEATQKVQSKSKVIDVMIKVNKDLIVIVIKNPVEVNIDTNNLISTKRQNGSYGFGLTGMKEIASKYGGEVLLTCENNEFNTHIILRNQINE